MMQKEKFGSDMKLRKEKDSFCSVDFLKYRSACWKSICVSACGIGQTQELVEELGICFLSHLQLLRWISDHIRAHFNGGSLQLRLIKAKLFSKY